MKHIILILCLVANICINAQDVPKLSSEGFSVAVNEIESSDEKTNYTAFEKWINKNYNNADFVIGSTIENELIRFTGVTSSIGKSMGYNYDLKYIIRVDFKDSRFRFTVENISLGFNGVYSPLRYSDYYKKNGDLRKSYKDLMNSIETEIQGLLKSSYNYLNGKTEKDDW